MADVSFKKAPFVSKPKDFYAEDGIDKSFKELMVEKAGSMIEKINEANLNPLVARFNQETGEKREVPAVYVRVDVKKFEGKDGNEVTLGTVTVSDKKEGIKYNVNGKGEITSEKYNPNCGFKNNKPLGSYDVVDVEKMKSDTFKGIHELFAGEVKEKRSPETGKSNGDIPAIYWAIRDAIKEKSPMIQVPDKENEGKTKEVHDFYVQNYDKEYNNFNISSHSNESFKIRVENGNITSMTYTDFDVEKDENGRFPYKVLENTSDVRSIAKNEAFGNLVADTIAQALDKDAKDFQPITAEQEAELPY